MRSSVAVALALPLLIASAIADAGSVVVRGQKLSVSLAPERARELGRINGQLLRAGLPGYVALYRSKGVAGALSVKEGATLLTTVERSNIARWLEAVGNASVGFGLSQSPNLHINRGSSWVRIGTKLYYFKAVRHQLNEKLGRADEAIDVRDTRPGERLTAYGEKAGPLTEVTFPVTRPEMAAIAAFFMAREKGLITDASGCEILPAYKRLGARGNLREEMCNQTTMSVTNPLWIEAFGRSVSGIAQYGREHSVPELAAANVEMTEHLSSFASRTSGIQNGKKPVIRMNFPLAPLVTVLNAGFGENPIREVDWGKGKMSRGMDKPAQGLSGEVMPDQHPAKAQSTAFASERMELRRFATLLQAE
jgi:hypothetical protein